MATVVSHLLALAKHLADAFLVPVVTAPTAVEEQKRCKIDFANRAILNYLETMENPSQQPPLTASRFSLPGDCDQLLMNMYVYTCLSACMLAYYIHK